MRKWQLQEPVAIVQKTKYLAERKWIRKTFNVSLALLYHSVM